MRWRIIDNAYLQTSDFLLQGQVSFNAQKHIRLDTQKNLKMIYQSINIDGHDAVLRGYERLTINCLGIQLQFTEAGTIDINGSSLISASTHRLSPSCIVLKPA